MQVRVQHDAGRSLQLPLRVKAFAVTQEERETLPEWLPPELRTAPLPILGTIPVPSAVPGMDLKGPTVLSHTFRSYIVRLSPPGLPPPCPPPTTAATWYTVVTLHGRHKLVRAFTRCATAAYSRETARLHFLHRCKRLRPACMHRPTSCVATLGIPLDPHQPPPPSPSAMHATPPTHAWTLSPAPQRFHGRTAKADSCSQGCAFAQARCQSVWRVR